MKKSKILKIIVITLLVILLSIISFGGIFVQDKNAMKNLIPDYQLSRELTGSRKVQLKVDDSVEKINYDAEGNVIEENQTQTEGDTSKEIARTEEIPTNKPEDLTVENYKKSREVFENRLKYVGQRLKHIGITDYTVRLNEDDGTMVFEIAEDANVNVLVSQLREQGKLEIIDANTEEVLLTNDDIEDVFANIGRPSSGTGYSAYVQIEFNKEKYREVSNKYIEPEGNEENNENDTEESSTENKTTKKITLNIDGDEIDVSSNFGIESPTGIIQLSVGSATEDLSSQELQDNYLSALADAGRLSSGKTPVVYTTGQNKYMHTEITENTLKIAMYVGIGIVVVGLLYLIIKYKKSGILSSIAFIGYIALILLTLRVIPNIEISIAGICAIALSVIINYIVNIVTLNSLKEIEDEKLAMNKAMIKIVKILVPALIVSIVFTCFRTSFGTVMIWALAIIVLYNYLITKALITGNKK